MVPDTERELLIDNLLFRIHFVIVMIRWTGLAPWEFEFPFPGSLISTFRLPDTHPNHLVGYEGFVPLDFEGKLAPFCLLKQP